MGDPEMRNVLKRDMLRYKWISPYAAIHRRGESKNRWV